MRISFVSLPDVNEKLALISNIIWLIKLCPEQTTWTALFMLSNDVVNVASVMNERVWNTGGIRLTGSGRNGFAA
jgi:hypothetical protein